MKTFLCITTFLTALAAMTVGAYELGVFTDKSLLKPAIVAAAIVVAGWLCVFATMLGDKLVLKRCDYDGKEKGRFEYYSCGDSHLAPGVFLRGAIHATFLAPVVCILIAVLR